MTEALFLVALALICAGAALLIYLLLPAAGDDEPTEHGDGEPGATLS